VVGRPGRDPCLSGADTHETCDGSPLPYLFDPQALHELIGLAEHLQDRSRCPQRGPTQAMIFAILATLGLRIGEVSRLTCGDIDLDRDSESAVGAFAQLLQNAILMWTAIARIRNCRVRSRSYSHFAGRTCAVTTWSWRVIIRPARLCAGLGETHRFAVSSEQAASEGLGRAQFAVCDAPLRTHLALMAQQCAADLADPQLHPAARKCLESLQRHWHGLTCL